jgi:hypothetical protein
LVTSETLTWLSSPSKYAQQALKSASLRPAFLGFNGFFHNLFWFVLGSLGNMYQRNPQLD